MIKFSGIDSLNLIELIYGSPCKGALILSKMTKDMFFDLFISEITEIPLQNLQNKVLTKAEKELAKQCLEKLSVSIYTHYGCGLTSMIASINVSGLSYLAIDYLDSLKGQPGIHYIDDIDYILETMGKNPTGEELEAALIAREPVGLPGVSS